MNTNDLEREGVVRIKPVTKAVNALDALKRVSGIYRGAVEKGIVEKVQLPMGGEDPQLSIRREELRRLNLLEILGLDAISR